MPRRPFLFVLAGVNGAGKSSIGGALLRDHGLSWFNPDTEARRAIAERDLDVESANAYAWKQGVTLLRQAIATRMNFAFETTLGGSTIAGLLVKAAATHDVKIWYCGLASPEMHIARVALRVAQGGHDIPEAKIRERWENSRGNLVKMIPHLTTLQVFDNSETVTPGTPISEPQLVLALDQRKVNVPADRDAAVPDWARMIVQAAFDVAEGRSGLARYRR